MLESRSIPVDEIVKVYSVATPKITDLPLDSPATVQRLDLRPGDRLVVTFPTFLTNEQKLRSAALWATFLGDGFPVAILDGGAQLAVLGKDET